MNLALPRLFFYGLLSLFLCSFAILQTSDKSEISGTVYDESKKPLADVEILNITNSFVTVSDKDGHFKIKGKPNDELKFTFQGKVTKVIKVDKTKNLRVYFDDQKKIEAEAKRKADKIAAKQAKKHHKKSTSQKPSAVAKVDHKSHPNPYKNTVRGRVSDAMGTLPGANVVIKGTSIGTQTDFDGMYGIDAKIGDVLVFSFVGLSTAEVKVTDPVMNVVLAEGAVLNEVVIEYDAVKKDMSVGYSASFEKLEGKVAGLEISDGVAALVADDMAITSGRVDINAPKAGQLTAGEVNDFSKWAYWEDLTEKELNEWQKLWMMSPTFRYSVVLTNAQGFGMPNKTLHLKDENDNIIWTSRTDNTGRAELWYKPEELIEKVTATLHVTDDENIIIAKNPKEFPQGINTYKYADNCKALSKVNIAFMVDATGSMDDEIAYLQSEISDVIARTKKELPETDLTTGSVFYRDFNDEYLVKNFDLTDEIPGVISFIKKQGADGGDDYPEAVVEGYEAAIDQMSWDDDARARLLFVVLDAPPHENPENIVKLQRLARKASEKGIRIIPIAASGIDKSTEYLMRAMALQTNGTYLFITNDSGIGGDHIAPSTDTYKVEMLNDLIVRIILQFSEVPDCKPTAQLPANSKIESQVNGSPSDIKWSYYPNPTADVMTIDLDTDADALYLYDTTGKLVLYQDKKARQYQIDLSGLPNAVYYLKVVTGEKVLFGKVVKRL